MGTELAKVGGMQLTPLDSQMVIKGICSMMDLDKLEQAAVVLLTCTQDGITPVDFMRRYHLVKGKPTLQAKTMLADLRKLGATHKLIENSPNRACIEITFEGNTSTFEITWEQAKASRWPWKDKHRKDFKDNWSTEMDRQDMLWNRVISRAVDVLAPEISHGIYTPEETEDYLTTPKDMDPRNEVVATLKDPPAAEPEATEATEDGEEIDAEFEVKSDEPLAAVEPPEEPAATEEPHWAQVPALIPDDTITGKCSKKDRAKMRNLVGQLLEANKFSTEDVQASIEDRGATNLTQLSKEQAAEIIIALEGLVADL